MLSRSSWPIWHQIVNVCKRVRAILRVHLNLVAALVLLILVTTGRPDPYTSLSIQTQEREIAQLVDALQTHLLSMGLNPQAVAAQGQQIDIVGPPDGTLFEKTENTDSEVTTSAPASAPAATPSSPGPAPAW